MKRLLVGLLTIISLSSFADIDCRLDLDIFESRYIDSNLKEHLVNILEQKEYQIDNQGDVQLKVEYLMVNLRKRNHSCVNCKLRPLLMTHLSLKDYEKVKISRGYKFNLKYSSLENRANKLFRKNYSSLTAKEEGHQEAVELIKLANTKNKERLKEVLIKAINSIPTCTDLM